jgi:hypothetical protein
MRIVIHMLRMFLPIPACPFGASLLTVWLILQGASPLTPDSAALRFLLSKTHPAPRPRPRREGDMMPFETQGPEPLDAVINVRLTAAEKARLKEDADLAGLSMSELVRRRYFGRPIIANADAVMLKELRRIGGLLKHIHNESGGVYSKETAGALVALKDYFRKLNDDR